MRAQDGRGQASAVSWRGGVDKGSSKKGIQRRNPRAQVTDSPRYCPAGAKGQGTRDEGQGSSGGIRG